LSDTRASEPHFLLQAVAGCERIWLVTTNDNLEALRFYQRRGFVLSALRPRAVDEARRKLKPQISTVGEFRIPLRDEIDCGRDTHRDPNRDGTHSPVRGAEPSITRTTVPSSSVKAPSTRTTSPCGPFTGKARSR